MLVRLRRNEKLKSQLNIVVVVIFQHTWYFICFVILLSMSIPPAALILRCKYEKFDTVLIFKFKVFYLRPAVAQGQRNSISTRGNKIFNIFISSLWYRGKARRCDPPLNTQWLNTRTTKNWKRSVLTLTSLILPCSMRIQLKAYCKIIWLNWTNLCQWYLRDSIRPPEQEHSLVNNIL